MFIFLAGRFSAFFALVLHHEIQLKIGTQVVKIVLLVSPVKAVIVSFLKDIWHQRDACPVGCFSREANRIQAVFHQKKLTQTHVADRVSIKAMLDAPLNLLA